MVLLISNYFIFTFIFNIWLIMLQVELIGNLGANAEVVTTDGSKFVKFRVAHTESWRDGEQKRTRTTWVDCTMNCVNGEPPAVLPWLQTGQSVFVRGSVSLRAFSSAKDRCWKAGMTIHVVSIELLGGKSDPIPRQLYSTDGAMIYNVNKFYNVEGKWPKEGTQLIDRQAEIYNVDKNGWVTKPQPQQTETDDNHE